jgi:putative ABC drug resistance transporter, inner membrane subunit
VIAVNLTYIRIELTRGFRDVPNLMFTFTLPVLMYLLFGRGKIADLPAGRGDMGFYFVVSLAAYGAVVAATSISAQAASESMLGWGRQLGLTRQTPLGFIANKAVEALVVGAVASGLVFGVGFVTGAKAEAWWVWGATWGIGILGAALFGVYGLAMALLLKSESAVGITSGSVVFFAFFGNVFMPLEGVMLDIARFTPMYGYVGLVRYPQLEGQVVTMSPSPANPPQTDSIWLLVGNYLVWTVIFVGLAVLGTRRSRTRQ